MTNTACDCRSRDQDNQQPEINSHRSDWSHWSQVLPLHPHAQSEESFYCHCNSSPALGPALGGGASSSRTSLGGQVEPGFEPPTFRSLDDPGPDLVPQTSWWRLGTAGPSAPGHPGWLSHSRDVWSGGRSLVCHHRSSRRSSNTEGPSLRSNQSTLLKQSGEPGPAAPGDTRVQESVPLAPPDSRLLVQTLWWYKVTPGGPLYSRDSGDVDTWGLCYEAGPLRIHAQWAGPFPKRTDGSGGGAFILAGLLSRT